MEKKPLGWTLVALLAIAVIFVAIYKVPQKNITPAEGVTTETKLTLLTKTDQKVAREEERVSIDVTYPQYDNVPAVINSEIKNFTELEIANIDSLKLAEIPTTSDATYFLKIGYETEQANTDFLSLAFTVNLYTGGAHPNEYFKTFNYDVKTGAIVTLASLYPNDSNILETLKPKIATAVSKSLLETLKENGDTISRPDDLLFKPISEQTEDVFENFTFNSNSLTFFFSPYDIAPYVAGPITANIER